MKDTATLIKNISSNYIRAQQAEQELNSRIELRHLLFAAQDIITLMKLWNDDRIWYRVDDTTAKKYAESLHYCNERIRELIAVRARL